MAHISPHLNNSEYTVGWIAALSHERAAAEAMLDKKHPPPQHKHTNDDNIYTLGSINAPNGEHNVVIASLPPGRYGTTPAAKAAMQMLSSFPAIKFGLMVGIGGGIPSNDNDIRLGDVVVSKPNGTFGGVRQYDCGKTTARGFKEYGALNSPPWVLLNAMGALESQHDTRGSAIPNILDAMYKFYPLMAKPRKGPGYIYQGVDHDRLFHPDYEHISSKNDCNECDTEQEVVRLERPDRDPFIHYGTIASGNQVVKNARKRDQMLENCLCFETEAAGLMNDFPCLVIRGICDYSDTHKNDRWQRYAAATAAAYAKELLQITDAADIKSTPEARGVMHELQEIKSITKGLALDREQQQLDRRLQEIFKWLSPLSPSARHSENQKQRVEGTGMWMLEDPKYLDWSSKTPKCQTLCCYGDPGAGKTIITSLVIDMLGEHVALGSKIGLAYMYSDYRDQKQQTTENTLGAVLKQLLGLLPHIPVDALKLYEEQVTQMKPLKLTEAKNFLQIICAQFSRVYVCLDALDELSDLRGLLECLSDRPPSMQLFITGRPHVREAIQKYFKEEQSIYIEAHRSDIRRYIEHEIGGPNDVEPDAMDKKLRMDILEKVVDSAEGIFLLPTLQVHAVLQATTIRDRQEALETLPSNLGEAFTGTMTRIEQQPNALSRRAGKVIAWIHLAEQPLTVDELLCSLAVKDGDTSFDLRGIPVRGTLLNCCHGLVVTDQETSAVRLVHYSLDEYLRGQDQIFGLTKAQWHSKIACTCLTFLNFPSSTGRKASDESDMKISILSYAATQWGNHLRMSEDLPDAPLDLAKEYLNTRSKIDFLSFRLLRDVMYPYVSIRTISPVNIAAFFGIARIMSDLISAMRDFDSKGAYGQTPLSLAAQKGHKAVVKLLIENGATVDSVDTKYGQTPLSYAAENGHKAVVKLLIENGAVVDLVDKHNQTPLSQAAENRHETVVKMLIENGATVDSVDTKYGQTPLSYAAENGHEAVVKLLVEKGAIVDSVDSDGQTPLLCAAKRGHKAVVKLLIENGAVVDLVDKHNQTPLSQAAENGHEAVVKLLVEKGAIVDSVDSDGQTPLLCAAKRGHKAVVKLLIENGAVVDLVDKHNQTPLSQAAENRHETVVKMLIENGATVDSVDTKYGQTPLSYAAENGHEAVVKLLIKNDAVVDLVDNLGQTPLSYAAWNGHKAVVKLLKESQSRKRRRMN
ncbi:hypothetical protein EPUS_03498 [Endocarpon pusillum Z07020]|uniref:Uncharacterized protein n=1 Tax=Endocarpon pusillum (strain Z07020 / HMAS-L-300199) TaxID=1263415 RepID=U1GGV4_ENDPU|nr:uncharacterized protein EPUS_03498 [Endocarpon pusillum Z07020]ERF71343.1 hypothetical protein EPUS_03498 [Endocarpon pusillum Z07020]